MSTASVVPETFGLDGDDARETLTRARLRVVFKDSVARFRWADGFSHARALAFQTVLTLVPGIVVAAGFAEMANNTAISDTILGAIQALAPGPAGDVFRAAATQGSTNAHSAASGRRALEVAAVVMGISAATTFGQIERAANRIYGVEKDRPSLRKYGQASLMALSAGVFLTGAFLLIALGRQIGGSIPSETDAMIWNIARWPVGAALLVAGYALIFRLSPRRRQPSASWLAVGSALSVALSIVVSIALALYLNISTGFGNTYGPLAGFMGVMLWSYLNAIALLLGLSFAAQLEAVRAGAATPQSDDKVEQSEPDADTESPTTKHQAASKL